MSNLVTPGQPGAPQDGSEGAQQQYGFQGQFGPADSSMQPGAVPPPPPPPPAKRRPTAKIISWLVFAVLIVVAAVFKLHDWRSDPARAAVGDCLKGSAITSTTAQKVNDIEVVACTSSDAKFKVIGKIDNKTEEQFKSDDTLCNAYSDLTSMMWGQESGNKGYVLCLTDVK